MEEWGGKFIRFSTLGTGHSLFPHLGAWRVCVGGVRGRASCTAPGMAVFAHFQGTQQAHPGLLPGGWGDGAVGVGVRGAAWGGWVSAPKHCLGLGGGAGSL